MKLEIIKNSKKIISVSCIALILSLGIIIFKGLNYGIDFSGGNLLQVKFEKQITLHEVNENLNEIEDVVHQFSANSRKVQIADDNSVIIRVQEINNDERNIVLKNLEKLGSYKIEKEDKVGASIGDDLKMAAIYSLLIGAAMIIAYITFRFEFIFSLGAIFALSHDLIVAIAVISLLQFEINTPFIAAVLTILGYSINDTIIVYDRIRENLKRKKRSESIEDLLDRSVNQMIVRTINTSVTTLFAIVAILLLGGESLRTFIVTLLVGILSGTYSSVFLATPVVYYLNKFNKNKKNGGIENLAVEKDKNEEDKILV